ncbi:hypothetical protein KKC63_01540 [Patescibacteria group bacterium]|nr:hypothetical protein [Patescibacteria group bacterium]MBU4023195.1 hypothetical protein [Patescibacteria group bacterium]
MNFYKYLIYLKTKTHKFLFWLSFIAFSLFLPFRTAKAIPGLDILTAPFVFLAKVGTAFVILVPVSWGLLALAQIFLSWASNPALVGGITTNEFVMEGWGIVRDFSNLFFILIVVAIGIATALRIRQYEVKKTLPRLIAVAVLINFSPVICGVIIDVSNILMSYFMTAGSAGFNNALSLAGSAGAFLGDSIRSALGNWSEIWRGILFVKIIFLIGFNLFAAFVLTMMGMLFMVRNLILWILVIFSPIAFISAVLPGTKKAIFSKWSQNFLKWTFIGVGASFFIYLSQLMLHLGTKSLLNYGPTTDITEFGGRTITNIMVLAVPFIFLVIGYTTTLAMAPMGAGAIMNGAKKTLGWAKGKGSAAAKNRLRDLRNSVLEKVVPEKAREKAAKWAKAENPTGWKKYAVGPAYMAWAKRKVGKGVGRVVGAEQLSKIEKETEEEVKNVSVDGILALYRDTKSIVKKLALLNTLVKNNKLDDAMTAGLKADEMKPVMKFAQQQHMEKDIFSAAPHLAESLITSSGGNYEDFIKKIKPERVKTMSDRSFQDPVTVDAIVKTWDGKNFGNLFREGGPEAIEKVEDSIIRQAGATGLTGAALKRATKVWLLRNNPALYKYKEGSAGGGYFRRI